MADFFKSDAFKAFVLPLLTSLLTVFIKMSSRNDRHGVLRRSDFAVGLDIALTAAVSFVLYSVTISDRLTSLASDSEFRPALQSQLISVPWIVLGIVFSLWGMSFIVRKFGWDEHGEPTMWCGIVLPIAYGLLTLMWVFNTVTVS